MKIVFTMAEPEEKKHSTRFDIEDVEKILDDKGKQYAAAPFDLTKFKPSFYVPKPLAENCKRIRVTIEEL